MTLKTARTVEPNAGRRRKYARQLRQHLKAFNQKVFEELLDELASSGLFGGNVLAQDDSISNPKDPKVKRRIDLIKRQLDSVLRRNPRGLEEKINEIVASNMVRWLDWSESEVRKLIEWYVRTSSYEVSASQRRALMSAGIAPQVFRERWKLPTVNQYISPNALAKLPGMVDEQTALITRMAAKDLGNLREVLTDCLTGGKDFAVLESVLDASVNFSEERARRVALDQSIKISQQVQQANAVSLGIEKGIWIHVAGQYTSRETHMDFHGKEFDLNKGLYDSDVKGYVLPGQLPWCRCIWRAVIPDGFLGLPSKS